MKKEYKKPVVEVIPFELNEAIASGCGLKVYNHADGVACTTTEAWNELQSMTGANLTEESACSVPLAQYCEYTMNGTGNFLFNSN